MKEILELARRPVVRAQGDYIQDGLLHCGLCHTPKEHWVELLGRRRKVACLCKCQSAAAQKQREAERAKQAAEALERQMAAAVQDRSYRKWTFATDDGRSPKAVAAAKGYCKRWAEMRVQNMGLLLYGDVGRGKTFAAACIANELASRGVPVLMARLPSLANSMGWGDERREFLRSLNAYDLLVLDDLGAERDSSAMKEAVYQIVDGRYAAGKPAIFTTNLTWQEFTKPERMEDRRTYHRILEMTVAVQADGPDRRVEKHKAKQAAARALLLED